MASVMAKLCCGSYVSNQMFHFSSFFRTEVSIVVVRVFPCRWRETCWIRDDNPIPDHDLCLCPLKDFGSIPYEEDCLPDLFALQVKIFVSWETSLLVAKISQKIENEYGAQSKLQGATGQNYVNWAAKLAVEMGTGVPWVMCKEDNAPYLVFPKYSVKRLKIKSVLESKRKRNIIFPMISSSRAAIATGELSTASTTNRQ
ncbi:hypothetical protein JHK87_042702 [Glycine soja]|nr:hypothetical protein JHK87_042702 [Glycine soja]